MVAQAGLPSKAFVTTRRGAHIRSFTRMKPHVRLHIAVLRGYAIAPFKRACVNVARASRRHNRLLDRRSSRRWGKQSRDVWLCSSTGGRRRHWRIHCGRMNCRFYGNVERSKSQRMTVGRHGYSFVMEIDGVSSSFYMPLH